MTIPEEVNVKLKRIFFYATLNRSQQTSFLDVRRMVDRNMSLGKFIKGSRHVHFYPQCENCEIQKKNK